jgi:hypothetical protein
VSVPRKRSSRAAPVTRSSTTSSAMRWTPRSCWRSTWHPLGRATYLGRSSAHQITRGVVAVERRMLCFL